MFQSAMNALNPVLNVRDQLARRHPRAPATVAGERMEKAGSLLDLVGIPRSRLRSYPHELSGGMRQRVMIAMALATDPEVVIMDEPTTALDVVVQRDILAQIIELKEPLGFAILFITHDLSLLLELADRIAVMYAGQLWRSAPRREIQHEPAHPYTKGLLNSFPSLHGAAPGAGRHSRLAARPARTRRRAARSCPAAATARTRAPRRHAPWPCRRPDPGARTACPFVARHAGRSDAPPPVARAAERAGRSRPDGRAADVEPP